MALKGQTTIELTNVETGEVQEFKDTNMLTNGLRHLLTTYPFEYVYGGSATKALYAFGSVDSYGNGVTGIDRAAQMLTGGLILFDTALEEDVDNIFPPVEAQTTACGVAKAYTGNNTMVGSYNLEESGEVENGYKHVWDFSTSHGNGRIACACLTTREGGSGAGTISHDPALVPSESALSKWDRVISQHAFPYSKDSEGNSLNSACPIVYADYEKNCVYTIHDISKMTYYITSGFIGKRSLTLDIRRFPLSAVSPFDGAICNDGLPIIQTVAIEMPDTLKSYFDACVDVYSSNPATNYGISSDEDFVYIWFDRAIDCSSWRESYWQPGASLQIWKINMNDFSSTHIELVNNTGVKLYTSHNYSDGCGSSERMVICNDYVLAVPLIETNSSNRKMYIININDFTDVRNVVYPDNTPVSFSQLANYNSGGSFQHYAGFRANYAMGGKVHFYFDGKSVCVDLATAKMYYTHRQPYHYMDLSVSDTNAYRASAVYVQHSPGLVIYHREGYRNTCNLYITRSPELLLTINNLETPITKTDKQTMKVTYTIVES